MWKRLILLSGTLQVFRQQLICWPTFRLFMLRVITHDAVQSLFFHRPGYLWILE